MDLAGHGSGVWVVTLEVTCRDSVEAAFGVLNVVLDNAGIGRRAGKHRQYGLDPRLAGMQGLQPLLRGQGQGGAANQMAGPGAGVPPEPREQHRPDYFHTEMNDTCFNGDRGQAYVREAVPLRQLGRLEELKGPFLMLANEAGSYVTGSTLAVDGCYLVGSL